MKALFLLLPLLTTPAFAALTYSEAASGLLSNLPESPTDLGPLGLGNSTISGTINEGALSFTQPDSFQFAVAEGQQLTSLTFQLSSNGPSHFLSLLDASINFVEPGAFLLATLITSTQNGTNILPLETDGGSFAPDAGAVGYELPLPSGSYSIWFQETQRDSENRTLPVDYTFQLSTQAIPEPATAALLMLASSLLLSQRRTRKNS